MSNRLSQIHTHWSGVIKAHQTGDAAARARNELAHRYLGAIHRYILGAVRNEDLAADLTQEFGLKLVTGAFASASPERGRFRDFIKTAVRNLITDYHRRRKPVNLPEDFPELEARQEQDDFSQQWRQELFDRTWEALSHVEKQTGQPFHLAMRLKAENLRSAQIAERLTQETGKATNEVAVRKLVQRAREQFAQLLWDEVARSIQSNDPQLIEEELIDLQMYEQCKPALERRADRPS